MVAAPSLFLSPASFAGGLFALLLQSASTADAFVSPKIHATTALRAAPPSALPPHVLETSEIYNGIIAQQPSFIVSDALDIVKNIAIAIGGIIAVLAAVAILFSTFIIPKAAEQLEKQAKELDPALWQEYESKLEPGEVLAMRPDLMQSLGEKVQAKALAEFQKLEKHASESSAAPPSETDRSAPSNVVDVDVISKEEKKQD